MNSILTTAGNFRTVQVGVGNHIAPQSHLVPNLMIDLFDWLKNTDEHPLIKSCVFHFEFEFIHPFSDGNGRIGRLWQTVILCHWKSVFSAIPTESIIRDNQQNYYDALEQAGNSGDSTIFVEFMLEVILITIKSLVKDSTEISENQDKTSNKYDRLRPITANFDQLEIKEKKVLLFLLDEEKISRKEAVTLLGLGETKTKEIFLGLIEKKLIIKKGQGRSTHYVLGGKVTYE